ncbi:MAG: hypothetical protein V7756_09045 [Halopseudomonas sp.]|uniref:hypothetical protein n=1 Tax=Halopseudomonas sp. TaxID=2901191 RepID=UPI003001CF4B
MFVMHQSNPHKRDGRPEFWQLAMQSCPLAGAAHTAFFFIFLLLGSFILAWVNVVSVGIYLLAYRAFKRRNNRLGYC